MSRSRARAGGDGADEARHDPREEKRQTVGVIFRGAHEVAEGAEGVRAESAGTLGAGDGLGVRDVEEEGDAVAEDGSDGVGEERGSVAGGMEGGDRVAEGGNGGDAEGLGVGVAFARARREDGDEDGEEVHGGVGGGAARVRATNYRPDAPDRRLERATTRRARRGREGRGRRRGRVARARSRRGSALAAHDPRDGEEHVVHRRAEAVGGHGDRHRGDGVEVPRGVALVADERRRRGAKPRLQRRVVRHVVHRVVHRDERDGRETRPRARVVASGRCGGATIVKDETTTSETPGRRADIMTTRVVCSRRTHFSL